ncbi:hypothetical protein C8Q80DRAFT_1133667 [Daedaleopsis nitida]|nr:hypothetical protein C8Q80DRAFT_1133667 [Daedaleopsis nitida]
MILYTDNPNPFEHRQEEERSLRSQDVHNLNSTVTGFESITVDTLGNSQPTVNQLPYEVLVLVFAQVPPRRISVTHDNPVWESSTVDVAALIPITQVCRRWRHVCMSTGRLWSNGIYGQRTSFNTLFLARAGLLPLACFFPPATSIQDSRFCIHLLQTHHATIRELVVVRGNAAHDSPLALALSQLPMPQLELCTIYISVAEFHPPNDLLFNDSAPRLRKLALHGQRSLPYNRFEQLTHLAFTTPFFHTNLSSFLRFLSGCPGLQHLCVDRVRFDPSSLSIASPIPCPQLRTLAIHRAQTIQTVNLLLSSITLPPNIAVAIQSAEMYHLSHLQAIEPMRFNSEPLSRVYFNMGDSPWKPTRLIAAGDRAVVYLDMSMPLLTSPTDESILTDAFHWIAPTSTTELWVNLCYSYEIETFAILAALFKLLSSASMLVLRWSPGMSHKLDSSSASGAPWMSLTNTLLIHSNVKRVRLCMWCGRIPPPVKRGLELRAQTGSRLAHLIIELPEDCEPAYRPSELEQWSEVVEIRRSLSCKWMEVPENFSRKPHNHWPTWHEWLAWPSESGRAS